MTILLTGKLDSYVQFVTVLLLFIIVLAVTAFTTRWIANYQKQQNKGANIEILETTRIANNKYIQIIRTGEVYMAIAVCKDTVTMLCEIPKEQLREVQNGSGFQVKELLAMSLKKRESTSVDLKENQTDEDE